MSNPVLDCHPADDAERAAAFGNVYEAWGDERPREEYVAWRMRSVMHARACWYVGCLDGRVVTSLGAYPVTVQVAGQTWPGFTVGAVHTVADCRRRGHAAALMGWVERQQRQQGAAVGLLYSDIDPGYYARMGYRLCSSWEGWARPASPGAGAGTDILPPAESLQPLAEPQAELDLLADCYRHGHGHRGVWLVRDRAYWEWLLKRSPEDEWFWWSTTRGFLRITTSAAELRVVDWAVSAEEEPAFWDAVLALAARRGVTRVGGWLPHTEVTAERFELRPRLAELTMIKPLNEGILCDDNTLAEAAWFLECDHV